MNRVADDKDAVLQVLDAVTRDRVLRDATLASLPQGTVLFRVGDLCPQFPIVLSGCIKVERTALSGREISLYRVRSGETCILTTSCLLASEVYSAQGVVEEDTQALALSAALFGSLLAESPSFRTLVFHTFASRIADLMQRIEEITDVAVDARLASRLLDASNPQGTVSATHHALASEIGSAREVISRVLKKLERFGLIRISRGSIDVLQPEELRKIAER
jgi:CRP/FNR family transcriptional regulator